MVKKKCKHKWEVVDILVNKVFTAVVLCQKCKRFKRFEVKELKK